MTSRFLSLGRADRALDLSVLFFLGFFAALWWIPALTLLMIVLTVGLAFLLSALMVMYRDIRALVPLLPRTRADFVAVALTGAAMREATISTASPSGNGESGPVRSCSFTGRSPAPTVTG